MRQDDDFSGRINDKLRSEGRSFAAVVRFGVERFGFSRLGVWRRLKFRGGRFGEGGVLQRLGGVSFSEFLKSRGLIRFHGIGKRREILVEINVDKRWINVRLTRDSPSWLGATKTSAATDPSAPISWDRFDSNQPPTRVGVGTGSRLLGFDSDFTPQF